MQHFFLASNEGLVFGLVIVAILAFAYILYYFSNKSRILRGLRKSKAIPIHRAQNGSYVKLVGKAKHAGQPLTAPLSGRKCIYYEVLVERKGDKSWHTMINDKKYQDFFLEVNGEMAMIKAELSTSERRVYLEKDHRQDSGFMNDPSAKLDNYLELHGKTSTGILGFNKKIRYREGIIELDEVIAVKGIAQWKSISEPIEGYSYSKILALSGTAKQKLLITDSKEATTPNQET